jgi:hypothetical protein
LFFGSFSGFQCVQRSPGLIELTLCSGQARLKFLLAELSDRLVFRHSLSLFTRLFEQNARHLECEVDAFCGFNFSRKRPNARGITRRNDHGLDRPHQLGLLLWQAGNDQAGH